MKETVSKAISNWDSTNPIQVSVVPLISDPTKYWMVVCNPDGSTVGWAFVFGTGSPEWVVTFNGKLYIDTSPNSWLAYFNTTIWATTWRQIFQSQPA
jgi:hypothetical protein